MSNRWFVKHDNSNYPYNLNSQGELACYGTYEIAYWYADDNQHTLPIILHDWEDRELDRLRSGEYAPVAWDRDDFWLKHFARRMGHYVHVSQRDASKLAYTETMSKGERDVQTQIAPGRYLKKFFGDILTDVEIGAYVTRHNNKYCAPPPPPIEVRFASTADEIEYIYTNGPSSCMSKDTTFYRGSYHPVRVYGDSDLKVAYYMDGDTIAARCLVRPDTMSYGRVYATSEYAPLIRASSLTAALERLGYRSFQIGAGFGGACIRLIHDADNNRVIGPYIDGTWDHGEIVTRNGVKMIQLDRTGSLTFGNTDGYASGEGAGSYQCEYCGEWRDEDEFTIVNLRTHRTRLVCESRLEIDEDYFQCAGTMEWYARTSYTEVVVDGGHYCLEENEDDIARCEFTNEWCWTRDMIPVYAGLDQYEHTLASPNINAGGVGGVIYDDETQAWYYESVQGEIDEREAAKGAHEQEASNVVAA